MQIRLPLATVFGCALTARLLFLDVGLARADWSEPAASVSEVERRIKVTPDDDPKKAFFYDALGAALFRRALEAEERAETKRTACSEAAATPGGREDCETEHDRAIAAAKRDRHASIRAWNDTLRRHPAYPRLETLLFALASVELSVGMNSEAHAHAVELIKRFPRSHRVAEGLSMMGDARFAAGDVEAATRAYEKIVTNYRDGPPFAHAQEMLVRCRSQSNEPTLRPPDNR